MSTGAASWAEIRNFFGASVLHFLFTSADASFSCASTAAYKCSSLRTGEKQCPIKWAAESVHLGGIVRDVAKDQVTYTPATGHLYNNVDHCVVEYSQLRLGSCPKAPVYILCCSLAQVTNRDDSCIESSRHLCSSARHLSTMAGAAVQQRRNSCDSQSKYLCISIWHLRISDISIAHEDHGMYSSASWHQLSSDSAPVKLRRGSICAATLYHRRGVWGIYTSLMAQLHSSVGAYTHQRLRNRQQFRDNTSAASRQLYINMRHSRWYAPFLARGRKIPSILWLHQVSDRQIVTPEGSTQVWKCTVNRVFCAEFLTLLFTCHDTFEGLRRRCCSGGSRLQHRCTESAVMMNCHCCERSLTVQWMSWRYSAVDITHLLRCSDATSARAFTLPPHVPWRCSEIVLTCYAGIVMVHLICKHWASGCERDFARQETVRCWANCHARNS
jgi:hypothetical protein